MHVTVNQNYKIFNKIVYNIRSAWELCLTRTLDDQYILCDLTLNNVVAAIWFLVGLSQEIHSMLTANFSHQVLYI